VFGGGMEKGGDGIVLSLSGSEGTSGFGVVALNS
jgi:hypothetical protein